MTNDSVILNDSGDGSSGGTSGPPYVIVGIYPGEGQLSGAFTMRTAGFVAHLSGQRIDSREPLWFVVNVEPMRCVRRSGF